MFPHLAKSHILQRLTSKANVVLGGRPAGAKYLRFGGVALGPTSGIRVPHEGGVPQKVETSQMGVSRTRTDGAGVEVGGPISPVPKISKNGARKLKKRV